MSAVFYVMSAFVTVLAVLITIQRIIPLRYMLGYAVVIDVCFSGGMLYMFMGTFTGVFSATIAGLMLACFLTAGRYCFGYSHLTLRMKRGRLVLKRIDYPSKVGTQCKHWCSAFNKIVLNFIPEKETGYADQRGYRWNA